jgi:hypothetical protein
MKQKILLAVATSASLAGSAMGKTTLDDTKLDSIVAGNNVASISSSSTSSAAGGLNSTSVTSLTGYSDGANASTIGTVSVSSVTTNSYTRAQSYTTVRSR